MGITVEKCLQAWTNSLRQMNAKADIVFFGDSLTYYGDFSSVFPDKVVCNLGLRGDTIKGMIERVEQIILLAPNTVYIMAGINDIATHTLFDFEYEYESLVKKIQELLPEAEIIIQGLLPVNSESSKIRCNNKQIILYNEAIYHVVIKYNLPYINLFSVYVKNDTLPKEFTYDGIHLYPNSYAKWYNILNKYVDKK